jgi:hypothetical protein
VIRVKGGVVVAYITNMLVTLYRGVGIKEEKPALGVAYDDLVSTVLI